MLKVVHAVAVISLTSHFARSAKILILVTIGGSQYLRMRNVAEELGTRGHEVRSNKSLESRLSTTTTITTTIAFNSPHLLHKC